VFDLKALYDAATSHLISPGVRCGQFLKYYIFFLSGPQPQPSGFLMSGHGKLYFRQSFLHAVFNHDFSLIWLARRYPASGFMGKSALFN